VNITNEGELQNDPTALRPIALGRSLASDKAKSILTLLNKILVRTDRKNICLGKCIMTNSFILLQSLRVASELQYYG